MLVIVQGNLQGIVTSFLLGDDCAVFGRTCNWLLEKRVVAPFKNADIADGGLSGAEIAKFCAEKAFADVPEFYVEPNEDFENIYSESKRFWRNVCHSVESVVADVMKENGGGHVLRFEPQMKRWVLQFKKNRNTDRIISMCLGTASSQEYYRNSDTYAADGWYEEEVYDETGLLTGFVWNRISREEKHGIYRFETILESTTQAEAEAMLNKKTQSENAYLEVVGMTFGKDFSLGDIVCVQYEFGDCKNNFRRVINGVTLGFEIGAESLHVDFKEV